MLYFAYGSNMDPDQMAVRCPGAAAQGPARLPDHGLAFARESLLWGGGVATVEPAPGEEVWGVLWEIGEDDEAALDRYEGVDHGAYYKAVVGVDAGEARETALIYVCSSKRWKRPSARYLAGLIRGARAHGLPDGYVGRLAALAD